MNKALEHLCRAVGDRAGADPPDAVLVGRFVDRRDAEAFAELVRRHGPMVWGACRRLLARPDAEDAFQATFLVLVRKAASVSPRAMVANYLYGVACQTARKARSRAGRRRVLERPADAAPEPATAPAAPDDGLRAVLDEELARLPDKYRAPVVLCDLEGKTRAAAARELGWVEGTLSWRLAAARKMLAARLARRGVTLGAGGVAAVAGPATAGVPPAVVAATLLAAGTGVIPPRVEELTHEVVKAMLTSKLKSAGLALGLAAVVVAGGIGMAGADGPKPAVAPPEAAPGPKPAPAPAPAKDEKKDPPFAWGKVVDDLQVGIGVRPGDPGDPAAGGINFVVKVRNVGKKEVTVRHAASPFSTSPPRVQDDFGSEYGMHMPPFLSISSPDKKVLQPGAEAEVTPRPSIRSVGAPTPAVRLMKTLRKGPEIVVPTAFVSPGVYRVRYRELIETHPKLATGDLRVEFGADGGLTVGAFPEADPDAEWAALKGKWRLAAATAPGVGTKPDVTRFNELHVIPGTFFLMTDGRLYAEFGAHLTPAEAPKALGIRTTYGTGEGWYHKGIYKLDGDTLTVCVEDANRLGQGKRPTDFTAEAGSKRTLMVFERVKK